MDSVLLKPESSIKTNLPTSLGRQYMVSRREMVRGIFKRCFPPQSKFELPLVSLSPVRHEHRKRCYSTCSPFGIAFNNFSSTNTRFKFTGDQVFAYIPLTFHLWFAVTFMKSRFRMGFHEKNSKIT